MKLPAQVDSLSTTNVFRLVVLALLLYIPLRLDVDPNVAPVLNTWVVIDFIPRVLHVQAGSD